MRAKKSLGQNFLTSLSVVGDIVRAAKVTGGDVVVEVGPGKGILTAALLKKAPRVIAVEKDDRLIPHLNEKFKEEIKNKNLTLVHGDILKLKIESLKLKTGSYKVVANIPYYITGQLLRFFLEHKNKPSSITILVQKEVGQRIVARPARAGGGGKESILSISVKLFGQPRYVRKVNASVFSPKPKVDSAILNIENIRPPFKTKAEEGHFFKILKTGFAHKRKILAGNLRGLFGGETTSSAFDACHINEKTRAENLSLPDWKCLAPRLNFRARP